MKQALLFLLCLMTMTCQADDLKAFFAANKSYTAYYTQGFDSPEEANLWSYTSTSDVTWTLSSEHDFNKINADSKYSLSINYASRSAQYETATSPAIEVKPNSTVEFYNYFSPHFLFSGAWKLYVIDAETNESTLLLDQFMWAQDNAYDEIQWKKFSIDIAQWAGKTVKFSFVYAGRNGEDEYIDDFCLMQLDDSEDAKINIAQGETIQFLDASQGDIASWQWNIEGGTPATSDEQNPTVAFNQVGTFSVSLTVTDINGQQATYTRNAYVTVKDQAPNAIIGMPAEGYLSPYVATFVPTGVPVQFRDLSTGVPNAWAWEIKGATPEKSNEQNPTVVFNTPGTYSLQLTASNNAGEDHDVMLYAVQAGGAQYVWNIAPEENSNLEQLKLGFYGNYAGSNYLDIDAFAEHFQRPLAQATIDSVAVFFISNTTVTPDAPITVAVYNEDANGYPGELLTSAEVLAGDIAYSDETFLPTIFKFDEPATVTEGFFIVVSGFPNNSLDEAPYTTDDIAIACCHRNEGEKSTSWQLVEDVDEDNHPLGTYQWFENTSDPVSMAIAPVITYNKIATNIEDAIAAKQQQHNDIYTLQGIKVSRPTTPGLYISNGKKIFIKK